VSVAVAQWENSNNLKEEDILQKWNSIDGNLKYFFWRKLICRETKTTF
jgi:hypothetical protein